MSEHKKPTPPEADPDFYDLEHIASSNEFTGSIPAALEEDDVLYTPKKNPVKWVRH